MTTWDKSKIIALLRTNNQAVERAMIALYKRQTEDEKRDRDTKHSNARGFSVAHSARGSYYARWVLKGNHLTGSYLYHARQMAIYYARQLSEIANSSPKP